MRHLILISLVMLSTGFGLISCQECGPSAEPGMYLNLYDSLSKSIDTLYAIGAIRPLSLQPNTSLKLPTGKQLTVPLNLNADSSQYVFLINGRQDTVTVNYKRNYSYRNTKCGYVLNITEPAGRKARTTRGKIQYVNYSQNSYTSFLNPERVTHISLMIIL